MVGEFNRSFETCAIIGLGFGDEGKGMAVAHETARAVHDGLNPVNVRFNGGPQAAHNVRMVDDDGNVLHHTHSQLGSGTMLGASTVITSGMLFSPESMMPEALHMAEVMHKTEDEVLGNVFVDGWCPVLLPVHAVVNRELESARGDRRHGSTGNGIGVARACEDAERDMGIDACVRVRDLFGDAGELAEKIDNAVMCIEERFSTHVNVIIDLLVEDLMSTWQDLVDHGLQTYDKDSPIHRMMQDKSYGIVFEGAQGMLLDERHGWFPHVTYGDMTDTGVRRALSGTGERYKVIGVTRSYQTRHGAGPMPSEGTVQIDDVDNGTSEWAGEFRTGLLDMPTLERVADVLWPDMVYVSNMDRYPGSWVDSWGAEVRDECRSWVPTSPVIAYGKEYSLVETIGRRCNTKVRTIGYGPTIGDWKDVA